MLESLSCAKYNYKLQLQNSADNRVLDQISKRIVEIINDREYIIKSVREKFRIGIADNDRTIKTLFDAVEWVCVTLDEQNEIKKACIEIFLNHKDSELGKKVRKEISKKFSGQVRLIKRISFYLSGFSACVAVIMFIFLVFGTLVVVGEFTGGQTIAPPIANQPITIESTSPYPTEQTSAATDLTTFDPTSTPKSTAISSRAHQPTTIIPRRPKHKITVNSYDSYEQMIRVIPPGRELIVDIFVHDPTEWPRSVNMTNANKIDKLRIGGKIHIDNILMILNQTTNVTHINLNNSEGKLCSWNEGVGMPLLANVQGTTTLNHTTRLAFQNMDSSCTVVFYGVAERLKTPNLQIFAMDNGIIDDNNMVLIHRIFKDNWRTLTHIKLKNSTMRAKNPFFDIEYLAGVLKNVIYIYLDYPTYLVNLRFCNILPVVTTLVSSKGYLWMNQIQFLSGCKDLSTLEVQLMMPQSMKVLDMATFTSHFNKLKILKLSMIHEDCEGELGSTLSLSSIQQVDDNLLSLTVYSKCRILLENDGGNGRFPPRREEKRYRRNGLNVLSYDIKF